jgi:hypothetical protein
MSYVDWPVILDADRESTIRGGAGIEKLSPPLRDSEGFLLRPPPNFR